MNAVTVDEATNWLDRLFIDARDAGPRKEDRKKAVEVAALAAEIERALAHLPAKGELTVIDAAAGKGYAGLAAATLAAQGATIELSVGDAGDVRLWPEAPSLVLALHACGAAADAVLDAAMAVRAARLFVVPCCTPAGAGLAVERFGIPRHAPVRRAFEEAVRAAER